MEIELLPVFGMTLQAPGQLSIVRSGPGNNLSEVGDFNCVSTYAFSQYLPDGRAARRLTPILPAEHVTVKAVSPRDNQNAALAAFNVQVMFGASFKSSAVLMYRDSQDLGQTFTSLLLPTAQPLG